MIRLSSSLSIAILAIAGALGLIVGFTGAYVSARGSSSSGQFAAQRQAIESQTAAAKAELKSAQSQLDAAEKARDAATAKYNSLGSRVDQMLETESTLQEQNRSLQSEIDSLIPAPNVVGLFDTSAQGAVISAGLSWSYQTADGSCYDYTGTYYTDKVFKQYPSAGTKMKSGSYVTLYYLKPYNQTDLYYYGNTCDFSNY